MYKDEKERLQKEAELAAQQSKESDLNNLIRDDTSNSQQDQEVDEIKSINSNKQKSSSKKQNTDLVEVQSEKNLGKSTNLEFTVHNEMKNGEN